MKRKIAVLLLTLSMLGACARQPVVTPTPTLQPTVTSTPTITPTPQPTFTPTPDMRVITARAQNLVLGLADLPGGFMVKYAPGKNNPQPSDRMEGPHFNKEVLINLGGAAGGAYINDTARIEGWYIYYYNDGIHIHLPDLVMSEAIRYVSAAGAQKYIASSHMEMALPGKYTAVQDYMSFGDASRAFIRLTNDKKYVVYELAYRNIVERIWIVGKEDTITRDLVNFLALNAQAKLKNAELNPPPQYVAPPTLAPQSNVTPAILLQGSLSILMLQPEDLPADGGYRASERDATVWLGNSVVSRQYQGGNGAAEYIRETGRLDGMRVWYQRMKNDVLLPQQVYDEIGVFQTTAGAQKHVKDYAPLFWSKGWEESTVQTQIGDMTRVFTRPEGIYARYLLVFSHKNYVHTITAYGLRAEADPKLVEMLAFTLLEKLQALH